MKIFLPILILFPFFIVAQITNEVYNEFFNRKSDLISYSQIQNFRIKKIKYTTKERQYIFKKDSFGKKN
jgi:hypothetical protein